MKQVVPLEKASDVAVFGSKAVGLGQAIRDGLPVPPGIALAGPIVEAVAAGERSAPCARSSKVVKPSAAALAVRSSAVDEDGAAASFAGQHLTLLNIPSAGRTERGVEAHLVVGELGLGHHLSPARRPVHSPERRRRHPIAARSRQRRASCSRKIR